MKVCLVTASTFDGLEMAADGEPLDEDSPLGILSLASALRARGRHAVACDLTHFLRQHLRAGQDMCAPAADWIAATGADVYAFSTICSSYPLTLRLAEAVRQRTGGFPTILGGPQATVTDRAVLEAFPCIDVVVRGEGEGVLPDLVAALEGGHALSDLRGVTFRENGRVVRAPDAPLIMDLDVLPDPAYDLDLLLPRRTVVSLEAGRGCPFACEFCSTNDFFRRKFRLKSPARLIEQMGRVEAAYGHRRFSLVHDMFTVDRRKVVAFCEAMIEADRGYQWSCSARTDCIDADLIDLLARAGCVSLFFGVESGSADQQRRMRKHLDLDEARAVIASASRRGVANTVSLIVGFPDETVDDLQQTFGFLLDAARHDRAEPSVHLLMPLAATPLAVRYRDQLRLAADIEFDAPVATTSPREASAEWRLIAAHQDVFTNFYLMPMPRPAAYLNEARLFATQGVRRCRWLFVALGQEAGPLLDVFDAWLEWRGGPAKQRRYYHSRAFVQDLLAFVQETYAGVGHRATDVILHYLRATFAESASAGRAATGTAAPAAFAETAVPRLSAQATLMSMPGSVLSAIDALKARRSPTPEETSRPTFLLVRRTAASWHELTELPFPLGAILQLCDGVRSVAEVVDAYSRHHSGMGGAPPDVVCRVALRRLGDHALLRFCAPAA
jgi:radical SAM superfamily enzyme YgiQ (UPF0313 family)